MIVPVVCADIDPGAIEMLITACADYHRIRAQATGQDPAGQHDATGPQPATSDRQDATGQPGDSAAAPEQGSTAEVLDMLEQQILAAVIQIVSGPGGVASFLRRSMLGKGLNGPSLPLDVGQS